MALKRIIVYSAGRENKTPSKKITLMLSKTVDGRGWYHILTISRKRVVPYPDHFKEECVKKKRWVACVLMPFPVCFEGYYLGTP
jgi:hypothetical protein